MRKRSLLTALAFLSILLLVLSCSDNATKAKTEGDPNDPNYLQAKTATETYVDSLFGAYNFASGYMSFDGNTPLRGSGPMEPTGDSLNINFDQLTCWWEIYVSSDTNGNSLLFIDSVTFEDASGCQVLPDSTTTTQLEYRAYANFSGIADSSSVSLIARESVVLSGIQTSLVVVDGSNAAEMNLNMIADYGETSIYYDYSGAANSVTFNEADLDGTGDARPISGSLDLSLAVDVTGPNGSASVSWTMTITFLEDHYHVYAESGENYWEWDHYYNLPL